MSDWPILHVAIPAPLHGEFDYLPPEETSPERLRPGVRLMVPFGRGRRCGVLLRVDHETGVPASCLKRAGPPLDDAPLLSAQDLELLHWAAAYYHHPLGEVVAHALPLRLRRGRPALRERGLRITAAGKEALAQVSLARAPRQYAVLQYLAGSPAGALRNLLQEATGASAAVLRGLREKGWITPCPPPRERPLRRPPEGPDLLPAQRQAIEAVLAQEGYGAFLLDGVTGSGKTEVYLGLARTLLQRDRQVLILVPEIALTPQLLRRFRARLGEGVILLHSGLAEGEREHAWRAAQRGDAAVVVGTRSAVFTPMPRLGLIVVDEEHDLSLKQQEGFRYSARDLAVMRGRLRNCPVVLGSATPSLESLHNAASGRYRRLHLPQRAGSASLPRLRLVDIRSAPLRAGLSPVLVERVRATLAAGSQALIFLNRRGYAPVLICHDCGWTGQCPRCDAHMTLHLGSRRLWCHHCGHQQPLPARCPECEGPDLRPLGQGTERLERELAALFPDTPIARIDRDATRRKGSLEGLLEGIRRGDYRLLLGTQMLAKGHHFPEVTLVAILDADQGLFSADYRAAERMAQLVVQVAGRAGRAQRPGEVLIQTRHPEHALLQTLVHQGYGAFAAEALRERQEARLPPFGHQALLRAEALEETAAEAFLEQAAVAARALPAAAGVEILGPVPAPMARRAGHHRLQLLLQAPERGTLQRLLREWSPGLPSLPPARRVRWSLDVDPQEMF